MSWKKGEKEKRKNFAVPFIALVASFSILLTAISILWKTKKQKQASGGSLQSKDRRFFYYDVARITNNIKKIIGRERFGIIHSGYLEDTQVATKILTNH